MRAPVPLLAGPAAAALLALAVAFAPTPAAAAPEPPRPGPKDRCAVCGMAIAPHASWAAGARLAGGPALFFDGPKDLFKLLVDVPRYAPGHAAGEVIDAWVTDYYTLRPVPLADAVFVVGSDVRGPMGAELVPFADAEAAARFALDHHGARAVRAAEVDRALLEALR